MSLRLPSRTGLCPPPHMGSRGRAVPPTPHMGSRGRAAPRGAVRQTLGISAADVEVLKQDPDSVSRRFYHSFLEDISELSQFVRH